MPKFFKVIFLLILLSLSACSLFYYEETVVLYRVRSGDSLSAIASRYKTSVSEISDNNYLSSSNKIFVGQILELPYVPGLSYKSSPKKELEFDDTPESKTQTGKKIELTNVRKYVKNLYWPASRKVARLTSKFGWRWLKFHEGIDLAAKTGTPVYAAHAGRVLYAGRKISGYGNIVILKGDNMLTVYAHNDRNLVSAGEYVERGENIARIGSTGKATGPHLHFEVRIKNKAGKYQAVDPLAFLP